MDLSYLDVPKPFSKQNALRTYLIPKRKGGGGGLGFNAFKIGYYAQRWRDRKILNTNSIHRSIFRKKIYNWNKKIKIKKKSRYLKGMKSKITRRYRKEGRKMNISKGFMEFHL